MCARCRITTATSVQKIGTGIFLFVSFSSRFTTFDKCTRRFHKTETTRKKTERNHYYCVQWFTGKRHLIIIFIVCYYSFWHRGMCVYVRCTYTRCPCLHVIPHSTHCNLVLSPFCPIPFFICSAIHKTRKYVIIESMISIFERQMFISSCFCSNNRFLKTTTTSTTRIHPIYQFDWWTFGLNSRNSWLEKIYYEMRVSLVGKYAFSAGGWAIPSQSWPKWLRLSPWSGMTWEWLLFASRRFRNGEQQQQQQQQYSIAQHAVLL